MPQPFNSFFLSHYGVKCTYAGGRWREGVKAVAKPDGLIQAKIEHIAVNISGGFFCIN